VKRLCDKTEEEVIFYPSQQEFSEVILMSYFLSRSVWAQKNVGYKE